MEADPWKRSVRNEGLLILIACAAISMVVGPLLLAYLVGLFL
jgi:hypothetical protein